ncbi:hypothetical protein ES703_120353 [subsurface metagenome]
MSRTGWKRFELFVAKALGVERNSKKHLGESAPDVIKPMGIFDIVIDCKNQKALKLVDEILNLERYKTNNSDIMAICFRKTNSKKTIVYMKTFYFLRLMEEGIKKNLRFKDLVVSLSWEDFLGMVKKIEGKSKAGNKKKK